jgi:hypothetical protein
MFFTLAAEVVIGSSGVTDVLVHDAALLHFSCKIRAWRTEHQ